MKRWCLLLTLLSIVVGTLLPEDVDAAPRKRRIPRRKQRLTIQSEPAPPAHKYGAGLVIGSNSGITGLVYQNSARFMQAMVSFGRGEFALIADYGVAFPDAVIEMPSMVPYYGYGLVIEKFPKYFGTGQSKDVVYFGARVPLGFHLNIEGTPLQIGLELGPGIFIVPETTAFFDGAIILRVLF